MGPQAGLQGPKELPKIHSLGLPFCSKPVFQHTITFALSKSLESDVTSLYTQKKAHFSRFLAIFGSFLGPLSQPGAPLLFKACILAYNNILFIKVPRIGCYFTVYPKNSSFLLIFSYFWQFLGPLQASPGPPLYSKHVFQHTIIFSLLKFPRIGFFWTVYPKKRAFLSCFGYFWQFFL